MKNNETDIRHEIQNLRAELQLPPFPDIETAQSDVLAQEQQILRYLSRIETPPSTTLAKLLISDGIGLPEPDSLFDDAVTEKLWEVIHGMAKRRHFLSQTDHLDDYCLYRKLWGDTLNQEVQEMDASMVNCSYHIDITGDGDEAGERDYLAYYADESERKEWQKCYPDQILPPKRTICYDRDRHLPQPESQHQKQVTN